MRHFDGGVGVKQKEGDQWTTPSRRIFGNEGRNVLLRVKKKRARSIMYSASLVISLVGFNWKILLENEHGSLLVENLSTIVESIPMCRMSREQKWFRLIGQQASKMMMYSG